MWLVSTSADRRSEDVRVLTIIIPELELCNIEWHVFFTHLVERADHATFDFTYTDPASPPGPGLLGPKMPGTGGQAPHFPSAAITPQDILDIQGNRKFLYLWGWARYSDILPNTPRRITKFCWQIFVAGDPLAFNPSVDPQSIRFSNVHQARGNCADDECVLQGLG